MSAYTIVTTSVSQGSDAAEVSTLSDEFDNESEMLGYSRRMAEEMLSLAGQLLLDFDFSNVAVYEGDLFNEDLDPVHPAFLGMWLLDDEGAAYVTAETLRQDSAEPLAPSS